MDNLTPMSADEIAAVRERVESPAFNPTLATDAMRLLATLAARDERIRQAEGLLSRAAQVMTICVTNSLYDEIRAFLGAEGRKG